MFCHRRPAAPQTVQMVIVWTARLTDHIASGVMAEKNIARYRYYPIYANIAQFPITQYRYRSNPSHHRPAGMWSRSRRLGLETVSRRTNVSSRSRLDQNAQRLGPVRLGSCLGLDPKRLGSRGGSRTISSRRDVSCRRAQLNYNSPMKTSRP